MTYPGFASGSNERSDSLLHVRPKPKRRPYGDTQAVAPFFQQALEQVDMDVVESNAHGHVLGRVEIEAATDTEKRFQVTPLPARSKLLDDKREGRGIRLERGRLMHAADCGAHKEGHPP